MAKRTKTNGCVVGTIITAIVLSLATLPSTSFAEEPVDYHDLLKQLRRALNDKDGLKKAVALADESLGENWCAPYRHYGAGKAELHADLVAIGRRAGRLTTAAACARPLLLKLDRNDFRQRRLASAILFEISLLAEKLNEKNLRTLYRDWEDIESRSFAKSVSLRCSPADYRLGGPDPVAAAFVERGKKHAAAAVLDGQKNWNSVRGPSVVSLLERADDGDDAARAEVTKMKRGIAQDLRQEAFRAYPSRRLAQALKKRGEATAVPQQWRLDVTRWDAATDEQKALLEQGKDKALLQPTNDGPKLRLDGWDEDPRFVRWERSDADATTHPAGKVVRTLRWDVSSSVTRIDEELADHCKEVIHLFATSKDGTVFYRLGANWVMLTGWCVGYGEDHYFELDAPNESDTFGTTATQSSYVNSYCGPVGSGTHVVQVCEIGTDVTCVTQSPIVSFDRTSEGFRAKIPAHLPPKVRKIVSGLDGLGPAKVAELAPGINAQLDQLFQAAE